MPLPLLLACVAIERPVDSDPGVDTDTARDTADPWTPEPDDTGDARPYTLVLVTLDTVRGDHIGVDTPFLAELAAQGLELRDLDTHSWTYPGIGAVLTGVHPADWGIESWSFTPTSDDMPYAFAESIPTLAELLSARGWATAYFTSNGIAGEKSGLDRGYALAVEYLEGQTPSHARAMADWLADNRERHRFLHLHVNDPHSPHDLTSDVCAAEVAAVDDGTCRFDFVAVNEHSLIANDAVREGELSPESEDYEACRLVLQTAYRCEIRRQDEDLRAVWDVISAEGDLDGALSVFVIDHGEALLDPWTNHGFDLRMPVLDGWGLVHWPGHVESGVNTLPTAQEDILPTIDALLGLELGVSTGGHPVDEVPSDRIRTTFFGGPLPSAAGQWGSVYSAHDQAMHYVIDTFGRCGLYDLAADSGELASLCDEREIPAHLAAAVQDLQARTRGYNAPPR